MIVDEAKRIIARAVVATAVRDFVDQDGWGSFPEIGEDDWAHIAAIAELIAIYPPNAEYYEAYSLLEARAD